MKKTHVPILRFSEFDEKWETLRIEDVSRVIRGSSPRPKGDRKYYGGTVPRLMVQDVTRDGKWVTPNIDSLTEEGAKLSRPCPAGTLTIVCSGTVGIVSFLAIDACIHDGFLALVDIDESAIKKDFLFHCLGTLRQKFESGATHGGVFTNLTTSGVKEFEFTAAPLPEQQKIADFLTAVDRRIQQLSQKKALLETWKKGVMQQLFSQAIRFKDDHGSDFSDWEEKQYSDVYTFKNTNSFSRDLLNYENGSVRNVHYGDIHTKFKSNFYLCDESVPFVNSDVDISRIAEDCYCQASDLVIADASEDYADVGKCIEIRDLGDQPTLAGLHTFIARPDKAKIASGFGGYLMQSRAIRLKIMTIAQGTKVLGLSKTRLGGLTLRIPRLDEQTKIATFLAAIDRKIEAVAAQVSQTQTFKQGLLQQMFV